MLVDKLHDLSGIESVGLSQVDKQAAVALFGLAGALAGVVLAVFLAAFALHLHLSDFGSVGIIGKELAELNAHNLLYEVFFVDVFKVAVDVFHERSYLFLVHVGLDYLVHHLVELLLAYLLSRRHDAFYELLADGFLYGAHL